MEKKLGSHYAALMSSNQNWQTLDALALFLCTNGITEIHVER